jgi:transforming growth factor-beta-induced protein
MSVVAQIDKVLLPPGGDCLSVAKANGLDSFVAAVDQAGLGDALSDPNGSFTIFAPKNSAFDALAGVTLTDETLATVLKYHVLLETATEADLSDGDSLTTLQGSSIDVDFTYIYWFIFDRILLDDNAKIVESDLVCTNGIIHVIDEVLLPPGVSL